MKHTARAVLLACLATGCQCNTPAPSPAPSSATAERRALLVGIDAYRDPGNPRLDGAENDVEAMRALLIERYGFAERDVMTLRGEAATGEAIIEAFRAHLIAPAGPGTIAVFHFSGHGRRVGDTSGDEPDGMDEAIVPYDATGGLTGAGLLDDTFTPLVDALVARGAVATLIFDSCYSGSPVRGGGAVRSAPPIGLTRGAEATTGSGDLLDGRAGVTVISAADVDEKANEVEVGAGQHFGALTWALIDTLRAAPAETTWRAAMAEVRHRVGVYFPRQRPAVRGDAPDRVIFGHAERPPPPRSFAARAVDAGVELGGGALHAVTIGSVFEVVGLDGEARGRVVVRRVGAAKALAEGESGPVEVPPEARAVEVARRGPSGAIALAIVGEGEREREDAERAAQALSAIEGLRLVDPTEAALWVQLEDGHARVTRAGGPPLGRAIDVRGAELAALAREVFAAARWLHLTRLTGAPADGVEFTLEGFDTQGSDVWRATGAETARLIVRNTSRRRWYAAVLAVADTGEVAVWWPPADAEAAIEPGVTVTIPPDGGLVFHPPTDRPVSRDLFHLVLTSRPADFSALADPQRGDGRDPHPLVGWFVAAERGSTEPPPLADGEWALHTIRLETCGPGGCPP